jgi:ABC-2 family transporter protein
MGNFIISIMFEIKRFYCRRNLLILSVMIILSVYGIQKDIDNYQHNIASNYEFQKVEINLFKYIKTYKSYIAKGFKVFFAPSPNMVLLSDPGIISELEAKINGTFLLDIHNNSKGRILMSRNSSFRMHFSDLVLLLGGLASIFFGFDALRQKDFLKILSSRANNGTIYLSIITARILLLIFSVLFIFGSLIGFVFIKGIPLAEMNFTSLTGYLVATFSMLVFFFLIGTIIGSIRPNYAGLFIVLALWLSFVIFAPGILKSIVEEKNENILSPYQLDNMKIQIVDKFEKEAIIKHGKRQDNTPEGRRKVVEGYWNNEFKQIEALEEQYKQQVAGVINKHNTLSLLLPTTFYTLTANEVSSRGYQNYLNFYSHLQIMRHDFLRFWINQRYYEDPKVIKSFIKGDENIFKGKSRLPKNFLIGLLLNLFYCVVLLFVSYSLYKRSMLPKANDNSAFNELELNMESSEIYDINHYSPELVEQFYNAFVGTKCSKSVEWKFSIDKKNVVDGVRKSFLYIPNVDKIPGEIKVGSLVNYFKDMSMSDENYLEIIGAFKEKLSFRFDQLDKKEQAGVLLSLAELRKGDVKIIIFNNYLKDVPPNMRGDVASRVVKLSKDGILVLILRTDSPLVASRVNPVLIHYLDNKYVMVPLASK